MDSNSNSNKASELQPSIIAKRDENDEASVLVSVQPPQGNKRTPVDICCVVDVSGSMNDQATLQNSSGQSEAHGLSLLDVVKHAVKTVIHVMQPQDRLSVVSFHTNAKVEIELTDMNDKGKKKAEDIVTGLQPLNSTNLWDGLLHGLEVLRKGQEKNEGRMAAVLLLTDGQPNVEPEGGHLGALKKYKDEHKSLNATINCFGFGYNMNSQLLNDLSVEGNGMYAFIPDSGFVGTSFVNATSNLLVTMARNVKISLEPQNGASIVSNGVLGGYPTQYNSWGALVNFDNLQYDQTKNVVVKMKIPKDLPSDKPYLAATVRFETTTSTKPLEETVNGSIFQESPEVLVQKFRLETVKIIREATSLGKTDLNKAKGLVANLIREIKASEPTDPRVKALLQDLEGQVTEALSKSEYFNKWGVHYLPSLANAHLLQICNNFKDPGVQVYGGKLFQKLRDEADAIFIKLPPPKPSHNTTKAVSSMSYYHSSSAPCFAGQCQVLMPNGTTKRVDEIKKGDHVMTLAGKPAQVLCVVKTVSADGMTHLVELGAGLLITPFHPVKVGSRWDFPCNLGQVYNLPCDAVYSFVLKDEHVMIINGVTCVTLGHNFQEENVKHEYFGSQRIVEDLKKLNGWENGLVVLNSGCLVRDRNTKLVTGLKQQQQQVSV